MSTQHDELIADILVLLSKLSERFEPGDQEMKRWMTENYRSPVIAEILHDTTMMTLKVLDAIGRLEPVNGITISRQAQIPKGSVSKITRRLVAKKLITQESLPNNKKEILFRTTPLGRELFVAHQAFDKQLERRFIEFLQRYQPDELRFLVRFLEDAIDASWWTLEPYSELAE